MRLLLAIITLIAFSGCASFRGAPENQSVNFGSSQPVASSYEQPDLNNLKKQVKAVNDNMQTVQNGLVDIAGKLTGIEATAQEMNAIKAELTGIKGDVKGDLAAFKTSFDTQLSSTVTAAVDAAIFKKEQNQNQGNVSVGDGGNVTQVQTNITNGYIYGLLGFSFLCILVLASIVVYLVRSMSKVKNEVRTYGNVVEKMRAATYPIQVINPNKD
jgi:hypothetical protein